jgi:hypothetical protein
LSSLQIVFVVMPGLLIGANLMVNILLLKLEASLLRVITLHERVRVMLFHSLVFDLFQGGILVVAADDRIVILGSLLIIWALIVRVQTSVLQVTAHFGD